MLPFLAKAMIPVVTVFITTVGVLQGIDYVKNKLKKRNENDTDIDGDYV